MTDKEVLVYNKSNKTGINQKVVIVQKIVTVNTSAHVFI